VSCCVIREVTLFEELQLLKEFEKFENEMEEKVDEKRNENLQMMEKVSICSPQINTAEN